MLRSKKGIAVWVSWVLVMGLALVLGMFFLNWATDLTKEKTDEIITRADQSVLCDAAGIKVTGICQNTQTLNINLSNSGDVQVDELLLRAFDIYGNPQAITKNASLLPATAASVTAVKQGALRQVAIIPIVKKDGKRLICQHRSVTAENVVFC